MSNIFMYDTSIEGTACFEVAYDKAFYLNIILIKPSNKALYKVEALKSKRSQVRYICNFIASVRILGNCILCLHIHKVKGA